MFKIVVIITYLVAPAFGTSATRVAALSAPFPTYRACVEYFDAHGLRVGWKARPIGAAVRAAGNIIESVQMTCTR